MSDTSARAMQMVVVTYPGRVPHRTIYGQSDGYLEEINLTTEQAVDLYNQLRTALYG